MKKRVIHWARLALFVLLLTAAAGAFTTNCLAVDTSLPTGGDQAESQNSPSDGDSPGEVPPPAADDGEGGGNDLPDGSGDQTGSGSEGNQEPPAPIVWQDVATWDELRQYGNQSGSIRLTADLTVADGGSEEFTPYYRPDGQWASTVVDMNGHCIRVASGGYLAFAGHGMGGTTLTVIGDGGEAGFVQMESGSSLFLSSCIFENTGLSVVQDEGAWLEQMDVVGANIQYASQPLLRPLKATQVVETVEWGATSQEVAAALPQTMRVIVSMQGVCTVTDWPVTWGVPADVSSGERLTLSATPLEKDGVLPAMYKPMPLEVAFLVDGAAITEWSISYNPKWKTYYYDVSAVLPESVYLPEQDVTVFPVRVALEASFDGGETWEIAEQWDELFLQLCFRTPESMASVRCYGVYQTEHVTYTLYTDALELDSANGTAKPFSGGSRGGSVSLEDVPGTIEPPVTLPPGESEPPAPDNGGDDGWSPPATGTEGGGNLDAETAAPAEEEPEQTAEPALPPQTPQVEAPSVTPTRDAPAARPLTQSEPPDAAEPPAGEPTPPPVPAPAEVKEEPQPAAQPPGAAEESQSGVSSRGMQVAVGIVVTGSLLGGATWVASGGWQGALRWLRRLWK